MARLIFVGKGPVQILSEFLLHFVVGTDVVETLWDRVTAFDKVLVFGIHVLFVIDDAGVVGQW